MSNLALRFVTALLAIPLLIAAIQWQNPLGVWLWVLVAQVAGLREWMNMTMPKEPLFDRGFCVVLGVAYATLIYYCSGEQVVLFGLWGVTVLGFLFFLFRHGAIETVAARVAYLLSGILYAGVLILPLALMKRRSDGGAWIYICLTSAWLSDTGAYFAGRFIGKYWGKKLWPAISPKKTWVGGFGGLFGSLVALSIAKLWYLPALTWLDVGLIAVPANILGQLGDLCESLIKRSVGVKDSGVLLPGHGGMLDRIDALLFVVPYVYAFAEIRF
jgi:phosphatidate cytidylyltransferase